MTVEFFTPIPDQGYARTFESEIDVISNGELLVRGRMKDHRFEFEHVWKVRTPDYEIIEAEARQIAGDHSQFDPRLCPRYSSINGALIGRGFSKNIITALGDAPGRQEHLWLAIEMARVSQQVYQYTSEFEAQFPLPDQTPSSEAHVAWLKDRAYMTDLPNSCYAYRDESATLFDSREVRIGFDAEIMRPKPGDRRVFWRNKIITVKNSGQELACESAMEDRIHDIKINFELSREGIMANARSRGLRVPYHGICEDPHLRTRGLNGLRITNSFVLQLADRVGGANGCTHLFDLSIDCLKLFKFL